MLKGIRVETTTDALRNLREYQQVDNYIADFGDVEVEYDETYKVYRVPAFAERIAKYSEAKQIDCNRWGCE